MKTNNLMAETLIKTLSTRNQLLEKQPEKNSGIGKLRKHKRFFLPQEINAVINFADQELIFNELYFVSFQDL